MCRSLLQELRNAGLDALWSAAAAYNPARHTRFSTYAVAAIQNGMRDVLAGQQLVRVPRNGWALAKQVCEVAPFATICNYGSMHAVFFLPVFCLCCAACTRGGMQSHVSKRSPLLNDACRSRVQWRAVPGRAARGSSAAGSQQDGTAGRPGAAVAAASAARPGGRTEAARREPQKLHPY